MSEREQAREGNERVAAFFDLDGTLTALPSLEIRFLRGLRYRKEIPTSNYFLWMLEAMRLMPRGISAATHGNKMYLRGVQAIEESNEEEVSSHKDGHQAKGQASAPPRRNPRLPVPLFLPKAVERLAWHAKQGHELVLVSGTLEPLARMAARKLEGELASRGMERKIFVCATRLEEATGRWTGRIVGEAMFGEAKARAVKGIAAEKQLDLARCFAYGDSAEDQWLLSVVGRPTAVNPSAQLGEIARRQRWTVEQWSEGRNRSLTLREARLGTQE